MRGTDGKLPRADDRVQFALISPEARLAAAVINRALMDLGIKVDPRPNSGTGKQPESVRLSAEVWIFSDKHESTFGLRDCCEILGLEIDKVRNFVRRRRTCAS